MDCVKSVPDAAHFFSLLERLYVFFSSSYVHQKWLKVQSEMLEGAPRELQRLRDTRWACRQITCRNLMERLSAVKRVPEDISEERHPDRAVEARGLLGQIDLTFTGLLSVFKQVLGSTTFLSGMSPKLDLSKAVDLIGALKQTFKEYRRETYFNTLWDEIMQTCDNCGISSDMPLPKRKNSYLEHCRVVS